jgi:hypothetical protein
MLAYLHHLMWQGAVLEHPEDDKSAPASAYVEVAARMRSMAARAKSQETREEFSRLAGLYERLAARFASSADGPPAPPAVLNEQAAVRAPWPEALFGYDRRAVSTSAPSAAGVYVLWKRDRWIYVGESSDIRRRLLEHLQGDNECLTREDPQGFGFELIPTVDQRVARQIELIRALMPLCNQLPA